MVNLKSAKNPRIVPCGGKATTSHWAEKRQRMTAQGAPFFGSKAACGGLQAVNAFLTGHRGRRGQNGQAIATGQKRAPAQTGQKRAPAQTGQRRSRAGKVEKPYASGVDTRTLRCAIGQGHRSGSMAAGQGIHPAGRRRGRRSGRRWQRPRWDRSAVFPIGAGLLGAGLFGAGLRAHIGSAQRYQCVAPGDQTAIPVAVSADHKIKSSSAKSALATQISASAAKSESVLIWTMLDPFAVSTMRT